MFFEKVSLEKIHAAFPNWTVTAQSQLNGKELTEAELNVKCFDQCIDYLRADFADDQINEQFTLLWRLIGNKLGVSVVLMTEIEEVHIAAVHVPPMILITLPVNFYRSFLESPVYHMGAIVFIGHQALALFKEMASDRWLSLGQKFSKQLNQDALKEEGRFLLLYKEKHPSFVPTAQQQKLINAYKSSI